MRLTRPFHAGADADVRRGGGWAWSSPAEIGHVAEDWCLTKPTRREAPRPGELVTGRVPRGRLDPAVWRAAGAGTRLSFEPLPPVLFATPEQVAQWSESLRVHFTPGTTLDEVGASRCEWADMLTPAVFNALRGLDMADAHDVARAAAVLGAWDLVCWQAGDGRKPSVSLEPLRSELGEADARAAVARRIETIETFVTWWRAMSADAARFAAWHFGPPRGSGLDLGLWRARHAAR